MKTEVKRSIYWTSAWILTSINFLSFIVSRSKFWITHPGQAWLAAGATQDRTYLASEFERNLSCYNPLTCLRSGGAFVSQFLINATTEIVELGGANFGVGQKAAVMLLVGLLWRILCVGIFFILISRLLVSLKASLLLTNTLIFVLGGLPLWTLGRILVNTPLGFDDTFINRANEAFYHMAYQDLFFYDYGFIAIIPLTIFAFSTHKDISKAPTRLLIVIGFILATFYEAFVPLVFLSGIFFGWKHKRELDLRLLWLVVGQAFWTLSRAYSIRFFELSDPSSIYFKDTSLLSVLRMFSSKGMANTQDSLPSIALQLVIIIFVAMTIGSVGGVISIILKIRKPISLRTINAANSVALATTIMIAGGYLTPKLVELGRQSLGITVAVVIFGFITTQNIVDKFQVKLNSNNLTTTQ